MELKESDLMKLEYAFSRGCSDVEACLYADVAILDLHAYEAQHPEWLPLKDNLRETTAMRARMAVAEAIQNGDKNLSQWYLERKKKKEFSQRIEQEHTGKVELESIQKGLRELITRTEGDDVSGN